MLNIVIPMAGHGSRFVKSGYKLPKPLIPLHGKPMIQVVINNIRPLKSHRFIFICLQEHVDAFGLGTLLTQWSPGCAIISIDHVTEGAACTVLHAKELINNDDELMIANSDQWIDFDINRYLDHLEHHDLDGLIMTMKADDPKWSFVELDQDNFVTRVVEKEVISNEATVGIYNFSKGSYFVDSALSMINKGIRVNNEFYVAPVYNEMIIQKKKIGIINVGEVLCGMYGLGTPEDFKKFLTLPISEKATNF